MRSRATVRTVAASVILSGILAVTAASIVAHGNSGGHQTVNVRSAATIVPDPVTDPATTTVPDATTTTPDPVTTTTTAAPQASVTTVPVAVTRPPYVPPTVMAQGAVPNRPAAVVPAVTVATDPAPPPTDVPVYTPHPLPPGNTVPPVKHPPLPIQMPPTTAP